MKIIQSHSPISDEDRAALVFQGDLIIYQNIAAMHELIAYADDLLREALGGIKATEAQHHFAPDEFLQRTTKVQAYFRSSQEAKALFFRALDQCGVDLENTFYDHFPMRIVPFGKAYDGARNSVISHHRDSWGSNIHSQINWWAPLYTLEEQRTIAIYPDYWHKPVKNNTATWSFKEYLAKRHEAENERRASYPSAPTPQMAIDESNVVKVMLNPGDILSFSSTHLHASVPNTTQATRYSVEMRTVNNGDLANNRAAPNIDNDSNEKMYQWFKNITNQEKQMGGK